MRLVKTKENLKNGQVMRTFTVNDFSKEIDSISQQFVSEQKPQNSN